MAGRNGGGTSYSCSSHTGRSHGPILRCLQCGLVFMKPKLTPAQLVHEYSKVKDPTYLKNIKARELTSHYNFSKVIKYFKPGQTLLDVGSYCGAFLKIAAAHGLKVTGVEPSQWAVQSSLNLTNARVIHGTLKDMTTSFDIITLWDVLEHFDNPVKALQHINTILKPKGIFLFSTLMIDNWFPLICGKYWPWYMDMHLFYFTYPCLGNILQQTGFKIIESRNYCHIITLEYLISKLGSLGIPGARRLSISISGFSWARQMLAFKFGDIKLFVCKKI